MIPRTKRVILLAILCLLAAAQAAFGQTKPRLGIMPFSGGDDAEGAAIANLFADEPVLYKAFNIVERIQSNMDNLAKEADFNMTALIDQNTYARVGAFMQADYLISGHISRLGTKKLIIIIIVDVRTFEQIFGGYIEYNTLSDIRTSFSSIAQELLNTIQNRKAQTPTLAVRPFTIPNSVNLNKQDAEVLELLLTVEIIKTGKYLVLTRNSEVMQGALDEHKLAEDGKTEDDVSKEGRGLAAEYTLNGDITRAMDQNMFQARILHTESATRETGGSIDYQHIEDGFKLMPDLALVLTDRAEYENRQAQIQQQEADNIAAEKAKRLAEEKARRARANRFWSIGALAGSSFADPLLIGTVYGTLAPFQYSFLELGCDIGFLTRLKGAGYYSVYPYARYALFIPFTKTASANIGAGGGYMLANYQLDDIQISKSMFTADFSAGLTLKMFRIAYSLRSDFSSVSHKVSVGFSYRFGAQRIIEEDKK